MRKSTYISYNHQNDSYDFKKTSINFFINVCFQVTRKCNFKCIHCCESEQMKELSLPEIKSIIDHLAAAGLKKIILSIARPIDSF